MMTDENNQTEKQNTFFKDTISIKYGADEFVFKIPTAKDKMRIASQAAKLRRETDPEGGMPWTYTILDLNYFTDVATFITLLQSTSAQWVFSPNPLAGGKPVMDPDKWGDNVPVEEVVDQFRTELDTFRESRN